MTDQKINVLKAICEEMRRLAQNKQSRQDMQITCLWLCGYAKAAEHCGVINHALEMDVEKALMLDDVEARADRLTRIAERVDQIIPID